MAVGAREQWKNCRVSQPFSFHFPDFRYNIKGEDTGDREAVLTEDSLEIWRTFSVLMQVSQLSSDWYYFTHYLPAYIPSQVQALESLMRSLLPFTQKTRKALGWSSWWELGSKICLGASLLDTCWGEQCSPETDSYPRSVSGRGTHILSLYPCSETLFLP